MLGLLTDFPDYQFPFPCDISISVDGIPGVLLPTNYEL